MPHTTPCISGKHWSHDFHKPALMKGKNKADLSNYSIRKSRGKGHRHITKTMVKLFIPCTGRQMWVSAPARFLLCHSGRN
jgi:hypothetical protein